jgi:hypothetical protein
MDNAVQAGVMFRASRELDHDGWVTAARDAAAAVALEEVSEAFIASLTSGRLDLRSALGSYAVARRLPDHGFVAGTSNGCAVCGLPPDVNQDLNVLNFERFKWGGVRRDNVCYIAFDLEQFQLAPRLVADATAIGAGRQVLAALSAASGQETASTAEKLLRTLKGNVAERHAVLDILGVCGVLETKDHRGYRMTFVPYAERELPAQRFVDRSYPACWWRGFDGVQQEAVEDFLPLLV